MSIFRRFFERVLGRGQTKDLPDQAYAYRIYWTAIAREWHENKRQQVAGEIKQVIEAEGFEPNLSTRRYRVPSLEDQAYAGASLVALQEVLVSLAQYAPTGGNDD